MEDNKIYLIYNRLYDSNKYNIRESIILSKYYNSLDDTINVIYQLNDIKEEVSTAVFDAEGFGYNFYPKQFKYDNGYYEIRELSKG